MRTARHLEFRAMSGLTSSPSMPLNAPIWMTLTALPAPK
jgi:hypothetical protein